MLDVVGTALKRVNSSHAASVAKAQHRQQEQEDLKIQNALRSDRIRRGTWHDGRLDCVSGNGVMSELGIGDEVFGNADEVDIPPPSEEDMHASGGEVLKDTDADQRKKKKRAPVPGSQDDISGLPIVVIRNYGTKGASKHEASLDALANWAAALIENQAS